MASLGAVTEAEVPRPTLVPPRPEGAGAKVVEAVAVVVAAVEAGAPKLKPEVAGAAPPNASPVFA